MFIRLPGTQKHEHSGQHLPASTNACNKKPQQFQAVCSTHAACAAAAQQVQSARHAQGRFVRAGTEVLPCPCALIISSQQSQCSHTLQQPVQTCTAPLPDRSTPPAGSWTGTRCDKGTAACRVLPGKIANQRGHDTYLSACSASSRAVNLASRKSAWTSSTSPRATSSRPACAPFKLRCP